MMGDEDGQSFKTALVRGSLKNERLKFFFTDGCSPSSKNTPRPNPAQSASSGTSISVFFMPNFTKLRKPHYLSLIDFIDILMSLYK